MATSFLRELIGFQSQLEDLTLTIFISSEVKNNLSYSFKQLAQMYRVIVLDVRGLQAFLPSIRKKFIGFDLVFTIFGPDYLQFIKSKKIVGFAQAWILYNNSDAYKVLPLHKRLMKKVAFKAKGWLFRGAHAYIVELEHVRVKMIKKGIARESNVYVVHNAIANLYREQHVESSITKMTANEPFKLGVISRGYSHKNLSILPKIKNILESKFNRQVEFYVTLNNREFLAESSVFQSQVINLGPKRVDECPQTYQSLDGVIFPSLLESFSATPLEALATGRALFASDRPFNRDVAGDFAYYFDPLEPESAARLIDDYITNSWGRDLTERLQGRSHAINFSCPRERALRYIDIIRRYTSD